MTVINKSMKSRLQFIVRRVRHTCHSNRAIEEQNKPSPYGGQLNYKRSIYYYHICLKLEAGLLIQFYYGAITCKGARVVPKAVTLSQLVN